MAIDPMAGMSEAAKASTLKRLAKGKAASERSKAAAETRANDKLKKQIADAKPADLSKYDGMSREEIRTAKIAEIQQRDKAQADAKAATRKEAGKKAAKTRGDKRKAAASAELLKLVSQIRKASDDEAVKLLKTYIGE